MLEIHIMMILRRPRETSVHVGLTFLLACLVFQEASSVEEISRRWDAPPLTQAISIRNGRTNEVLEWEPFLEALAAADVVFLGESHLDETTHRAQLAIYDGLLALRQRHVILAMEMFERDVQPDLDAYLKGEMEESEFLAKSRPWGNYRTAYRPLIERARREAFPIIASNFPRPLLRRVALEGPEILESLPDQERHLAPQALLPNSDAYWRRAENATRSHRGMVREGDRLYSTQSLWDNAMGESCALALNRWPDHLVLHINGDFHSTYWDGAVHQLRQRKPEARVLTVSMIPVPHPTVAQLTGNPIADYVVFVEARAEDRSDDSWSVWTPKKLDYRFHLPRHATATEPVPLLMVLIEEGLTAEETMDLWRERLGESSALAVLDPLYQERQRDQGLGGRWYWNDSFSTDIGTSVEAIERMWGYLARNYPIDPERIVLFGEGTGGTVATATLLLTQRMDLHAVVANPRQFSQLKDLPLPLPEEWGDEEPPRRSLALIAKPQDNAWWKEELAEFRDVGMEAELQAEETDPWKRETSLENLLRVRLGLPTIPDPSSEDRLYFLLDSESPRARHWARIQSLWSEKEHGQAIAVLGDVPTASNTRQLSLDIQPEKMSEPGVLPVCPGPFGGTTVVVLPKTASPARHQAWIDLQNDDPLAKTSRFHRLRVATTEGDLSLDKVLEILQKENRRNVLIVPATFHAETTWLDDLRRLTQHFEDQMTLNWMPGLGGIRGL